MIPSPYDKRPVVMSVNKAAKFLGADRKTLAKNKRLLNECSVVIGGENQR